MYQAQRYFRALELNKVLEKLSEQANCDDSKQMALSLTPLEDYAQVKALMQKTADAYMLSARYTSPALHKLKNCEAALKKAEKGSNLSLRNCWMFLQCCTISARSRTGANAVKGKAPLWMYCLSF